MGTVHVAITRRVKPGSEAAFEAALLKFIAATLEQPGLLGAHLLRPAPGSASSEYGILRAFDSEAARDTFYASPEFAAWNEQVSGMVEGECQRRTLHGFEAFFRRGAPPRWKMAVLTWLAVWPTSYFWSVLLKPLMPSLNGFLAAGIIAAFIVATLAWLLMPMLSKVFRDWLVAKE